MRTKEEILKSYQALPYGQPIPESEKVLNGILEILVDIRDLLKSYDSKH